LISLPLLRRQDVSKHLKAHNEAINHSRHFNGTIKLPRLRHCGGDYL
jgi:hypothetical protein